MSDYIWPLIAALGLVLAYRVLMRFLGNAPIDDVEATQRNVAALQAHLAEHVRTWDTIGQQWRAKVLELEQKTDRVVIDAKNEIAGSVAQVADITKKGWR